MGKEIAEQALEDLEVAEAQGDADAAAAARKRFDAATTHQEAAQERRESTGGSEKARRSAPRGRRSTPPRKTTHEPVDTPRTSQAGAEDPSQSAVRPYQYGTIGE